MCREEMAELSGLVILTGADCNGFQVEIETRISIIWENLE